MARHVPQGPGFGEQGTLILAVIRGQADPPDFAFERGTAPFEMIVGSRGDWRVSGPGVVHRHLRLRFDGEELFATSLEGTTYLRGQPLSSALARLREGDELRLGFVLLRVQLTTPARAAKVSRSAPPWLLIGGGVGVLLISLLVVALVRGRSETPAAAGAKAVPGEATSTSLPEPVSSASQVEPLTTTGVVPPIVPPPADPAPVATLSVPIPDEAPPQTLGTPGAAFKPPAAFPQNIANRPVPRVGDKPWQIAEEWQQHHERLLRVPARVKAKLIFLGDSITEGWGVSPAYKEYFGKYSPFNLGIASDTTQNVLWRLEHGALEGSHPQVVVTMIGINNLAGGFSVDDTVGGVRAVVASVQKCVPEARILLLGILPARQDATNPLRQKIQDTNRQLAALAMPGRVEFSDVGQVLLEADGSISKTTLRDFVHPTPEGFERLSKAVAPHVDAMLTH
jgi:beta-glucosidase